MMTSWLVFLNENSGIKMYVRESLFLLTFLVYDDLYSQTYYISRTWEGDKIVDHSDVVGASPVGAAPTASSFSP